MHSPARFAKVAAAAGTVIATLLVASPASATWSVVGVDSETGEVGVAVASCVDIVDFFDLEETLPLVALVPGTGAAVSQATFNDLAPPEMGRLLREAMAPAEVLAAVTDASFDAEFDSRQHGVVTLDGTAGAFTGAENPSVALDRQADSVTAQGNTLVSDEVIESALAAFEREGELPLADRLVAALWAGSEQGGDARCGEQTALFASVAVAGTTDDSLAPSTLVTITAAEGTTNPVEQLADQFGVNATGAGSEESSSAEAEPPDELGDGTSEPTSAPDGDDEADGSGGSGGTIAAVVAVIVVLVVAAFAVQRRRSKSKQG